MPAFDVVFSQTALVFTKNGTDRYGQAKVDPPVEIKWLPSDKLREVMASAFPDISTAVESTALVDRPIIVGSIIWPGMLIDWLGTGSNKETTNLLEVRGYTQTPDLKNQSFVRQVKVMRYKHTVPYG